MSKFWRLLWNERGNVLVSDPAEPPATPPVEPPAAEPPATPPVESIETIPVAAQVAERKKRQAAEQREREAREEAAYWKGIAESGGKPPVKSVRTTAEQVPVGPPLPPDRPARLNSEDFETWAEFEDAQAKLQDAYLLKTAEYAKALALYEVDQRDRNRATEQTQAQKVTEYNKRLSKAVEIDPEIQDIANNWHKPGQYQLPLNDAIQEAILESEVGPELLRHFYNNKQETAKLAQLGATAVGRAIGKIEEAIIAKSKITPKQVSSAPEPITPVSARGPVVVDDDKRPAADVIREMREASWRRG